MANGMKPYECIVRGRNRKCKLIVRYFASEEAAIGWLTLEGYKIVSVREILKGVERA